MISEKSIDKFIKLYRREFGEDISRTDAIRMATRLLSAVRTIHQPISTYHREKIFLLSAQQWNFEQRLSYKEKLQQSKSD